MARGWASALVAIKAMVAYSPYHNVKDGTAYRAVFTTAASAH
jgi:prolyl oligopeptidase PreP (S9A serine peptidase family)